MKYIAIIHKEQGTAYGVTLPDFPGCFSAADTLDEVPRNIQEAVPLYNRPLANRKRSNRYEL